MLGPLDDSAHPSTASRSGQAPVHHRQGGEAPGRYVDPTIQWDGTAGRTWMSAPPAGEPIAARRKRSSRIELLGSLRADIDGREVASLLPGHQGRSLFAFLVLNRHRPVRRDELLDVLWPRTPPQAPEAGLSTVLARVRRAVGAGLIDGRSELRLRLEPDVDVDVDVERVARSAEEAERALAEGDPGGAIATAQAALGALGSPLLPGLEGAWVDAYREELAERGYQLLETLARAALAVGGEQLATAERAARTLVDREPFRESGYALLIKIHARRGNVAEATRTYHRLRVFLRDELGTAPSASLSGLHEDLLNNRGLRGVPGGPRPSVGGHVDPRPGEVPLPVIGGAFPITSFVGREAHLERLRTLWLKATTGQLKVGLLVGEAGVGKTRLAGRFASEVHRGGGTVLYGRCDEEPLLSYEPFVEALRHYLLHGDWEVDGELRRELGELSRLIPEARPESEAGAKPLPTDASTERHRLFEAIAVLVASATQRHPLLLVLDDLHWADKPTLLLLRHVLRRTGTSHLMVLGLFRGPEVGADHPLMDLILDLRRERRFDRLLVEGFDDRETDILVTARLEAPAAAGFVRSLRTRTAGNPFFMEETLRSLVESEAVESGEVASERTLEATGVPESVTEVILRRLGRLSGAAGEALTAAAVIGREFELGVVSAVLGESPERVLDTMEEAMTFGLVVEVVDSVDRFAFRHALVREAIYGQVSTSRRLRLHLRVGEALEAGEALTAANASELAQHFFLARDLGGAERAVRYAVGAGREAARSLAYEESAEHYRRALQAFSLQAAGEEAERCDVLLALGRVQWQAGESAARKTYFEAAASARRRGAAEQLACAALGLSERYWEARLVDKEYHRLLAEVLKALSNEDSKLRVRLMARMAENLHFTAEQHYGCELSLEALEMARRLDDVDSLVTALMGRHVSLLHIEHLDERLALSGEVLALSGGDRALSAEAHHWRVLDLCELGKMDEARREHAKLDRLAQDVRQPLLQHLAVGWQAAFAHLSGDVEDCEQVASKSFDFADRAGVGDATSSLASMLFTLRRQQGRVAELLPTIESLVTGASVPLAWHAALALAHVETGGLGPGRERYERLVARGLDEVPRDWYWFFTTALLAEICVRLHDVDRAPLLYGALAPFADRYLQVIFTVCWGSVERHLGMLAGVMDDFDAAEEHFQRALERNERIGAVLMTAETRCELGGLLLRRDCDGDRDRAAALGALVEQVAAPRGLNALLRRAHDLQGERRAPRRG